jgi:SAM-dependent methyltransferase
MRDDADRIIELYQRRAREWDEVRHARLIEQSWLDRFGALLPPAGSVLDFGCGSGDPIARNLIERGFAVTGVDSSPAMIEMCKARHPASRWIVGDMRSLSLGRRFDGLLAWDSFFHLRPEDQRSMFPIWRAHATAGAALMFTSGPRYGEAIGEFHGEPLYHSSLDPAEYRSLLDAHDFDVVEHVIEDPSCGGHTIWLARRKAAG